MSEIISVAIVIFPLLFKNPLSRIERDVKMEEKMESILAAVTTASTLLEKLTPTECLIFQSTPAQSVRRHQ